MHDSTFHNLNILGEKKIFMDGANRVCYLLACAQCGEPSYHPTYAILKSIKNRKQHFFCSQSCSKLYSKKSQVISCETCNKVFEKLLSQIKLTKHNFCSRKCAAIYHNKNKTTGTRRSKLEKYLEENIKT